MRNIQRLLTESALGRKLDMPTPTLHRRLERAQVQPDFKAGRSSLYREERLPEIQQAVTRQEVQA